MTHQKFTSWKVLETALRHLKFSLHSERLDHWKLMPISFQLGHTVYELMTEIE